MKARKILAGVGAAVVMAGASVMGLASPAQAAAKITVTPNSNLKNGDTITVKATGFPPGVTVAIGQCPKGRKIEGPGDCAAPKTGASSLNQSGADGSVTKQLKIVVGKIGNTSPPSATCDAENACVINASTIGNEEVIAPAVDLKFAGASKPSTPKPAAPSTPAPDAGNSGSSGNAGGGTNAGGDSDLAQTGPRETLIVALIGAALLQLGLVFAVRATRSTPRRSAL